MADDLATLGYRADLTGIHQINKGLTSVGKTGEKTERSLNKSSKSIAKGFKLAGAAILAVGSSKAVAQITSITRQFDVLNAQLITATKSTENAAMAFGVLQEFAATTPYSLQQSVDGFTKLVNLGLTPSEEALRSYGNTASAMGKDLSQMIEAVADATTGEFERLKEFGIKAKSQGDSVSLTFQGVTKTIGKNAAEIEQYLMRIGQNQFAGAMEQRAKTLDGAISNLADSWDALFLTVSKQGVGSLIQDSVVMAANAIQSLDEYIASGALSNSFGAIVERFGGYTKDIKSSFEILTDSINSESSMWWDVVKGFFGNMVEGFKQLPEMTRFYMQLVGVRIGQLVDYAKLYGRAFVDSMSAEFELLVAGAKTTGAQIANAINPFADDINFDAQEAKNRQAYKKAYKKKRE